MIVALSQVSFAYPESAATAVSAVDLQVRAGECVLILGHNGAGKSTLLKLLNGLLKPSSGTVRVNDLHTIGNPVATLAAQVAVTFQRPADQIFRHTVEDEVRYGPQNLRRSDPERSTREALELFGLLEQRHAHPYDLHPSRRKVLTLASAVAMEAPVLAFDEPTAGLSHPERRTTVDAFRRLLAAGRTLIVATHDIETLLPLATQVMLLRSGSVQFAGTPDQFRRHGSHVRAAGVRFSWPQRITDLLR